MAKVKLIYVDHSDMATDFFYEEYLAKYVKENECVLPILCGEFGYQTSQKIFLENVETVKVEKLVIITNNITLLNCINIEDDELWFWGWNRELKNVLDIYPNLRKVNNLMKMYMTGMFEEV